DPGGGAPIVGIFGHKNEIQAISLGFVYISQPAAKEVKPAKPAAVAPPGPKPPPMPPPEPVVPVEPKAAEPAENPPDPPEAPEVKAEPVPVQPEKPAAADRQPQGNPFTQQLQRGPDTSATPKKGWVPWMVFGGVTGLVLLAALATVGFKKKP